MKMAGIPWRLLLRTLIITCIYFVRDLVMSMAVPLLCFNSLVGGDLRQPYTRQHVVCNTMNF